jgi:iron-sulfur cluster assembly accessory protein
MLAHFHPIQMLSRVHCSSFIRTPLFVAPKLFSTTTSRVREMRAAISLTVSAAERIKEMMQNKEEAAGVRISVKRRGCNGYSYTMNYKNKDEITSEKSIHSDEVVESHGVQVFVDPKAVFFLVGTEMDYVETELSSEFTFTNPNSKGSCGCGESFNV